MGWAGEASGSSEDADLTSVMGGGELRWSKSHERRSVRACASSLRTADASTAAVWATRGRPSRGDAGTRAREASG